MTSVVSFAKASETTLFYDENGNYTRPVNFMKRYYRILKAAKIERKGLHSLRHIRDKIGQRNKTSGWYNKIIDPKAGCGYTRTRGFGVGVGVVVKMELYQDSSHCSTSEQARMSLLMLF